MSAMVARIVLVLGVLVTTAGLFFGTGYVPGSADGDGDLLAGPTRDGLWCFIAAPFIAMVYLLASTVVAGWPSRRRGKGPLRFRELLWRLCSGRPGLVTSIVFASCSAAVCYGTSAYWSAAADGLSIHRGWGQGTTAYTWTAVQKRFIGCVPSRIDWVLRFDVETPDGEWIDLASARPSDFSGHFFQLVELTRAAVTDLGDIKHCPKAYQDVLQWLVSEHRSGLGGS